MGAFHPQVVHFAIALVCVGVLFRIVALAGRPAFLSPAAATLILLGTVAVAAAVQTGEDAHGPVEQMPGVRPAVEEHEDWAARTHNIVIALATIELVALVAGRTRYARYSRPAYLLSSLVGLGALFGLYETAEHGGRIVYAYAGGIGTRSGDAADVQRLHLAALYQQGMAARRAGQAATAAAYFTEAADRFRTDVDTQLAAAESHLVDRMDAAAALDRLRSVTPPADNRAQRIRHGMLLADALERSGQRDAAVASLQQLNAAFPNVARIEQRLAQLQRQE
jgi:uncharacterized membrane protein